MATPPQVRVVDTPPVELRADALAVGVFRGGIEAPGTEAALDALGLSTIPETATFTGRMGETLTLAAPGQPFGRLLLVGLGDPDRLSEETLRRAAGAATRVLAPDCRRVGLALALVHPAEPVLRAVAEGALLGAYRFDTYRSEPEAPRLRELVLLAPTRLVRPGREVVKRAVVHARATQVARDLVNLPAADKVPAALAERIVELCGDTCEVEVWDEDRLAEEGCGGILAVGRGSANPPRLVTVRYRPPDPVATVALVGKGITFDAGGLSLKRPWSSMVTMKSDLGGAAAVVGVCTALADLDVRAEVIGICACAENLPSGEAQRPGDVLTTRDGHTVEVRDTDAEGRLALADALGYAVEQEPDAIVDLATLTGHVLYAVGEHATGVFGSDDDLVDQLLLAAEGAGEPAWRLPLWEDLRERLDSDVADLTNLPDGKAGASLAGLFLREFVGEVPWAHLDIAGAAWRGDARWHHSKGGTGAGVRWLLRWLEASQP